MADLERLVIQPKRWRPTLLGLAVILPPPFAYWVLTTFKHDWTFDSRSLFVLVPVAVLAIWQMVAAWLRRPFVLTPDGFSRDGGANLVTWRETEIFIPLRWGGIAWKLRDQIDPLAVAGILENDWRMQTRRLMPTLEEWHRRYG